VKRVASKAHISLMYMYREEKKSFYLIISNVFLQNRYYLQKSKIMVKERVPEIRIENPKI